MPGHIKLGGVWHEIVEAHVCESGAYNEAFVAYIKEAGKWKVWHIKEYDDDAIMDIAMNKMWPEA